MSRHADYSWVLICEAHSPQFTGYFSTPLLLVLQPSTITSSSSDITGQTLPFKAYEPTVEIRDKKTRSVFIEAPFKVETGEAERIAVDWTAKGGGGSTSRGWIASSTDIPHHPFCSWISSSSSAGSSQDVTRANIGSCAVCDKRDRRYVICVNLKSRLYTFVPRPNSNRSYNPSIFVRLDCFVTGKWE